MDEIQNTREHLMDTALALFALRGYEAAGVQEIVTQAGITKPTLYYYFGSKQGLLEAIVTDYGAALLESTRNAAAYNHDLVMNLTGIFRLTIKFAGDKPDFYRLMMSLFSAPPETEAFSAGKELRRNLAGALEELFSAAAKDHGNMKGRQKIYAETFMGLLETFSVLTINNEIKLTDHLSFRIVHQYMHGIFS
ncbi:TetR/AcrR family transcriptional regulator [Treponema primitia]|uniref:TetR/AcrR family transcriptional regulator n=1 Tax=Treponema primitia TaxID=88058 RepID=UPI00025552CD|nr:TetR/AcrR family transcriptional regulator [Treponema primitia]